MTSMLFALTALAAGMLASMLALVSYKRKYETQNIKLAHCTLIAGFVNRILLLVTEKQGTHNTLPILLKETREFFQFKAVELYEVKNSEIFSMSIERRNSEIRGMLASNWESVWNSLRHDTYHSITLDDRGSKLYIVPIKAPRFTMILCMQEDHQYPALKNDLEVLTRTLKYMVNIATTLNEVRLQASQL